MHHTILTNKTEKNYTITYIERVDIITYILKNSLIEIQRPVINPILFLKNRILNAHGSCFVSKHETIRIGAII